ncbi:MAG: hypothetical protein LC798_00965 [Chloroflexi bacterium]|nr:hypothetical protein [Chloroflexota bacterium]
MSAIEGAENGRRSRPSRQRGTRQTVARLVVRGAHQLYSRPAHERRYARTVARAYETVPYYRERWRSGQAHSARPHTPAAHLEDHLARLFPLAHPLQPRGELPPWLGGPRELLEALLLTEEHDPSATLLEIRPALLDWRSLGPCGIGRYGVVLSPDAIATPTAARVPADIGAMPPLELLGSATELTATQPALEHPARQFVRVRLDEGVDASVTPVHAAVLFDSRLGYIGARASSCGEWHLNWRRVHCRTTSDGLAFTKLVQRRPTLVDVVPEQASFVAVAPCARHGSPVLVGARDRPR